MRCILGHYHDISPYHVLHNNIFKTAAPFIEANESSGLLYGLVSVRDMFPALTWSQATGMLSMKSLGWQSDTKFHYV